MQQPIQTLAIHFIEVVLQTLVHVVEVLSLNIRKSSIIIGSPNKKQKHLKGLDFCLERQLYSCSVAVSCSANR